MGSGSSKTGTCGLGMQSGRLGVEGWENSVRDISKSLDQTPRNLPVRCDSHYFEIQAEDFSHLTLHCNCYSSTCVIHVLLSLLFNVYNVFYAFNVFHFCKAL